MSAEVAAVAARQDYGVKLDGISHATWGNEFSSSYMLVKMPVTAYARHQHF